MPLETLAAGMALGCGSLWRIPLGEWQHGAGLLHRHGLLACLVFQGRVMSLDFFINLFVLRQKGCRVWAESPRIEQCCF
jgi:hypothetical protein